MPSSIRYDCGVIFGPWFHALSPLLTGGTGQHIKPCYEPCTSGLRSGFPELSRRSMRKKRQVTHKKTAA